MKLEQLVAYVPPLEAPDAPDDEPLVALHVAAQSAAQSRTRSMALVTTGSLVDTSAQAGCE